MSETGGADREASIEIVPYNPSWPGRFEEEAQALRRALAAWLVGPVEHIGTLVLLPPRFERITSISFRSKVHAGAKRSPFAITCALTRGSPPSTRI